MSGSHATHNASVIGYGQNPSWLHFSSPVRKHPDKHTKSYTFSFWVTDTSTNAFYVLYVIESWIYDISGPSEAVLKQLQASEISAQFHIHGIVPLGYRVK